MVFEHLTLVEVSLDDAPFWLRSADRADAHEASAAPDEAPAVSDEAAGASGGRRWLSSLVALAVLVGGVAVLRRRASTRAARADIELADADAAPAASN